jgi:hypothetical protein
LVRARVKRMTSLSSSSGISTVVFNILILHTMDSIIRVEGFLRKQAGLARPAPDCARTRARPVAADQGVDGSADRERDRSAMAAGSARTARRTAGRLPAGRTSMRPTVPARPARRPPARKQQLVFRPLTARLMNELGEVLRGSWGAGCWCMHPRLTAPEMRELPGDGTETERRRQAMTRLARRRRAPGLLAFEGDEVVGSAANWQSLVRAAAAAPLIQALFWSPIRRPPRKCDRSPLLPRSA